MQGWVWSVVKADPTEFAEKWGWCERRAGGGPPVLPGAPKFGASLRKKDCGTTGWSEDEQLGSGSVSKLRWRC